MKYRCAHEVLRVERAVEYRFMQPAAGGSNAHHGRNSRDRRAFPHAADAIALYLPTVRRYPAGSWPVF